MTIFQVFTIIFIAIGLSMDCFAVSLSAGISNKKLTLNNFIKISSAFGLFQGAMPVFGWLLGSEFSKLMSAYDHWIALCVLALLGLKMIYESIYKKDDEKENMNILKPHVLIGLSIATSIDALAVGLSFAFLKMSILISALIIGFTTFNISMLGMKLGQKFGRSFKINAELIGGIILIIIGLNIFIQHTFTN